MDFKHKLNDIFAKYPNPVARMEEIKISPELKKGLSEVLPKVLYNIHKRSLPIGVDKPILFNLTESEAKHYLERLKPKLIQYNSDGLRIVHYYEKVRTDGPKPSIYANPPQIVI